jgi:hypothetical protein
MCFFPAYIKSRELTSQELSSPNVCLEMVLIFKKCIYGGREVGVLNKSLKFNIYVVELCGTLI